MGFQGHIHYKYKIGNVFERTEKVSLFSCNSIYSQAALAASSYHGSRSRQCLTLEATLRTEKQTLLNQK